MGANVKVGVTSLNGKYVPVMLGRKTIENNETIEEALKYSYVMGKPSQIEYNVKGVLKAMVAGIGKDGNGRKIDSLFSMQPVIKGKGDDVCDDIDKSKLKVVAKARALKDMTIDSSNWNVSVEGSSGSLRIDTISTGEKTGYIYLGEDVNVNGYGLVVGATSSFEWSVPGTSASGTIAAEHLTSEYTRLTIAAAAFAEIRSAEFNGKTIEFKFKIGNNVGRKSALLVFND